MKKTIFISCLFASAVAFSNLLYADAEDCNVDYIRQIFVKSEWVNNTLVDSKKNAYYTVMDLDTNQELGDVPQERHDLEYSKVQFTQYDPTTKTCTVTILKKQGGNLTVKLTPQNNL